MKYNVFVSPCLKDKVFSSYEILKFIQGRIAIKTIICKYVFCNEKETFAFLQYEGEEDIKRDKFTLKAIVHDNCIKNKEVGNFAK